MFGSISPADTEMDTWSKDHSLLNDTNAQYFYKADITSEDIIVPAMNYSLFIGNDDGTFTWSNMDLLQGS